MIAAEEQEEENQEEQKDALQPVRSLESLLDEWKERAAREDAWLKATLVNLKAGLISQKESDERLLQRIKRRASSPGGAAWKQVMSHLAYLQDGAIDHRIEELDTLTKSIHNRNNGPA
jgi:phosphoenolpyruvate-protein kinase (PTS system EI component)